MAYIQPNSTIRLLQNCPLDKTYDHTIYFASESAQATYFSSLASFTYSNASYVRKNRAIKVQATVGQNLYTCNYLMFKNTSFENKWFYAFITHVEYDNNLTWIIEFELDVMQTWFFDYELERCFVEREHSATDNIGDNLVPENLDTGDYVSEGITRCTSSDTDSVSSILKNLSLVFACTFKRDYSDFLGGYYGGLYSGLCYIDFPFPEDQTAGNIRNFVNDVQQWINGGFGKINGIVSAFVMPTAFISSAESAPISFNKSFYKTKKYDNIDGYVPKNNKLFTYPYNFLYCTNFQGQGCAYKYEYFEESDLAPNRCWFMLECGYGPNPTVILTPRGYKGVRVESNYDEKMTTNGYPQLPFATDVYQAWLANGAGSSLISAMSSIAPAAIGGGAIGGPVGASVGAISGAIFGIMRGSKDILEHAIMPPQAHNGAGGDTMCAYRVIDFGFMRKHIRREFAEMIDNYFSMFGYATHRCKIPNRNVRPHWTYTKTVGCCITGSVPADDMAKICSIYDNGITFWRNGSEVGQYQLNNTPT